MGLKNVNACEASPNSLEGTDAAHVLNRVHNAHAVWEGPETRNGRPSGSLSQNPISSRLSEKTWGCSNSRSHRAIDAQVNYNLKTHLLSMR